MAFCSPAEEKRFLVDMNELNMADAMSLLQRQPITGAQQGTCGLPTPLI